MYSKMERAKKQASVSYVEYVYYLVSLHCYHGHKKTKGCPIFAGCVIAKNVLVTMRLRFKARDPVPQCEYNARIFNIHITYYIGIYFSSSFQAFQVQKVPAKQSSPSNSSLLYSPPS